MDVSPYNPGGDMESLTSVGHTYKFSFFRDCCKISHVAVCVCSKPIGTILFLLQSSSTAGTESENIPGTIQIRCSQQ